ncbi:hypothetical protein D9757_003639 [Collybiopsis confluens]|uniref:Ricin B lectin domain-containing protein n=1 Tax=Collybiopsis confluens TaxID=2823264 RepID=A0A8H5HV48_9AGAR|nr:hypothetical protein D9757_003639 [Collybiopsis confluens]
MTKAAAQALIPGPWWYDQYCSPAAHVALPGLGLGLASEAQQRDNTATRAFSAAQIQTADGQCLAVDPASGDFRENLIPIQVVACNGSDSQQWDVITSGVHNNEPGFALITSTLTNGCLNFDPRRAAGNQVLLFSCGGRADGSGAVANSQLFAFTGGAGPFPLVPQNGNNATCLTVNGGLLDQTSCNSNTVSGNELFTISGSGSQSAASGSTTISAADASASTSSSDSIQATSVSPDGCTTEVTITQTVTPSSAATSSVATSSPETSSLVDVASSATATVSAPASTGTTVLNSAAVAEAQQRDNTATRAFSDAEIKTSDGQCLSVDANSGDFRENLIPVAVQACDGSAGQKFDVITAGKHNNVPGTALIVSTLTQGCMQFDSRQSLVDLFSCGGRADGSGQVSTSQLFTFTGGAGPFPLVPQNGNNAVCLTVSGGQVVQTSCNPSSASGSELFTISGSTSRGVSESASSSASVFSSSAAKATSTTASVATSSSNDVATAASSSSAGAISTTSSSSTASAPAPTGTTVLNPTAVSEAQQRDDTATRAFSNAQIKSSDGQCLSVDANSGDFRENLIPVTVKACDSSAGQKFDVITAGKHNNVPGTALFVSTLTQGCLNFDPRRAAGNQVILFSCGGRADGSGAVTNSQLFTFSGNSTSIPLEPTNQANTCMFNNNGNLDVQQCNTAGPASDQVFTIVS